MVSASSMARTLGNMVSVANLRIESAIKVSVSERCVIGVGGMEEMSWTGIWASAGRRVVVEIGRKLSIQCQ